jgi:hypothetical protein
MTLRELLETLKCLGVTLTLHDGDAITIEPPDVLTRAVRAALTEHHVALVALIRSGPSSTSAFDALMTAFDGVDAPPSAEVLFRSASAPWPLDSPARIRCSVNWCAPRPSRGWLRSACAPPRGSWTRP